jgi:segregation and condensation protein A
MTFKVDQEKFSGPLQLLLELIEKEELSITEVSLAKVTEDYFKFINLNTVPAEELADFLVVATRLLLLKSRAILPDPEGLEEEATSNLALQLRMYKKFVDVSRKLNKIFEDDSYSFSREKASLVLVKDVELPEGLDATALQVSFERLIKKLEPFFRMKQAAIEKVVSVKERLGQIRKAILHRSQMTFSDVVKGSQSKVDVVVSFLALLELVKQNVVNTIQKDAFSDIDIKHIK